MKRHPEYSVKKQKTLDIQRKCSHGPIRIAAWFQAFRKVVEQYGFQPGDIYNMNETGFRIDIGKDQKIITKEAKRQSYLVSSSSRELVTVMECIAADRNVIPPMIILPGKLHMDSWFTNTKITDSYVFGVSDTGYSNNELSYDWLQHFQVASARRQKGTHRLLLFDGNASHCTYEFVQYCDQHQVVVFCLPPHATHFFQPLNVVLFQPYKHHHAEAIDQAT